MQVPDTTCLLETRKRRYLIARRAELEPLVYTMLLLQADDRSDVVQLTELAPTKGWSFGEAVVALSEGPKVTGPALLDPATGEVALDLAIEAELGLRLNQVVTGAALHCPEGEVRELERHKGGWCLAT